MIRVGVVAAMWSEAQCFAPHRSGSRGTALERRIEIGEEVMLSVSGIGPERAARTARELLSAGARALVSAGVAGGLDPRLAPGDIVIADRVIAADGRELATDAAWRAGLADRLRAEVPCTFGALAESTSVLASPADKRALFDSTRALAVDMESAAIADEAARAGVPCLVLRVVCDPADMSIPRCALSGSDAEGRPRLGAFALALLAHPSEIGAVFRLQRAFTRAQRALVNTARIAGPRLCASDR